MTQDLAGIHYRLATLGERAEVGELRWALKTDDGPVDEKARAAFVARFLAWHDVSRTEAGVFHWVAVQKARVLAVMSVMDLRKLPALTEGATCIGYLTNCYVTPEFRGHGIGSRLLGHIKQWAADKRMELLLVWPGESAYPFYADNGFARAEDPLVVNLRD